LSASSWRRFVWLYDWVKAITLKVCIFVRMLCRNVLPAEVDHLFKSLKFLGSYSGISGFYIVADIGHLLLWCWRGPNGLYVFLAASIVIKFRLAENLALGYSDFMDEGLRMLFLH
jgi:hypothetical protein